MSTLLVAGKKPRFNPWLIVKYAMKFWPLSVGFSGLLLCYITNEVSVALSYEGLLWIPMVIGVFMVGVGIVATIFYVGILIFDWAEGGGWSGLKDTIDRKAQNYGRPEDK